MKADFPYLDENSRYRFPPADNATQHGIVGVGGNLSPGMLLSAYSQGVFPWYSEGEPLLWWNPDPRFVLYPEDLHIAKSLRKARGRGIFRYTFDTHFEDVIAECSRIPRPGQDGTWITSDMIDAYVELHRIGFAHSLEVWSGDRLAGGLYGVSLGRLFFGESMFNRESGASKAGFVELVETLSFHDFQLIDCQVYTEHLDAMERRIYPEQNFLSILDEGLAAPSIRGDWSELL